MINPCAELIPDEQIKRAESMSTALICDGAKFAGIDLKNDGCLAPSCKPVADGMRVMGTALTVQTEGGSIYPIQAAIKNGGPGYVLVVNTADCRDRSHCGDIVFSSCKAVGLNGMVIDGLIRDKEGTARLGFPVFAVGITPRSPVREKCGSINIPIECCGINVRPGDFVLGDTDGVVVIPREHLPLVLDKAEEKLEFENERIRQIAEYNRAKASGEPLPEIVPKWALDYMNTN